MADLTDTQSQGTTGKHIQILHNILGGKWRQPQYLPGFMPPFLANLHSTGLSLSAQKLASRQLEEPRNPAPAIVYFYVYFLSRR